MRMEHARKQTILIADDSELNREILIEMLGDKYDILEATNGEEAVAAIKLHGINIDLMLLDIVMPKMDGFEVLNVMAFEGWLDDIPVIMISSENQQNIVERAYELGVTDFISRPYDVTVVSRRITNTLLLYAKQRKLVEMVAEQIYEKEKQSRVMIDILSHIVEFRNGESGLHVQRIHVVTDMLLHRLRRASDRYSLTTEQINNIIAASALHDIGKIAIPGAVLNKPGPLDEEEMRLMRSHTVIGAQMLTKMSIHQHEPLVRAAYDICRWHHERYDGSGYPDGLKGDEIPISAQVVAVADVYDALVSAHAYKKAFSHEEAVRMILEGQCGAFNPLLLECLCQVADGLTEKLRSAVQYNNSEQEIQAVTEAVNRHKELSVSGRTLQMLEHERMKSRFYADMSGEIQFEFTSSPPMLTLTSFSAQKLGLEELVLNPLQNERILTIMRPEDVQGLSDALHATTPEEPVLQYECKVNIDGEERWGRVIARAIWTNNVPPRYTGAIGKAIDIHDERVRMNTLEWQSSHDALTGLFNHAAARRIVTEHMKRRPRSKFSMMYFDVDAFKSINDTRGHLFGDLLLRSVAERLRQSTRRGDVVARIGGDEFMVFIEYKDSDELIVQRVHQCMTGEIEGCRVTCSMGVARSAMLGTDYETLFHAADQALYVSKEAGGARVSYYNEEMKNRLSALGGAVSGSMRRVVRREEDDK